MENINQIAFWLIAQCLKTDATSMTIEQKNLTKHGENLGDWEIIIRKIEN